MSNENVGITLKRLSKAERWAVRTKLFNSGRKSELGQIAATLFEVESEIRRLQKQVQTLFAPRGDRVMAKMVAKRLRETEAKAINLLRKALDTKSMTAVNVQIRLLIAERADYFEEPAKTIARDLRRVALDEWLQLSA